MCIAAIIKEPISREYLHEMNKDNPHGGGVAWLENGLIRFERGLDDKAVWDLQINGVLTFPYLLHFRWATHGARVPELTHPFPTGPRALFGELSGYAKSVLMHNGVWNSYAQYLNKIRAPRELIDATSDTGVAAYMLGIDPSFVDKLDSIPWATAVAAVDDAGKLVIGEFGHTWTDYKGNRYSNLQWLPVGEWWEANGSKYSRASQANHYSSASRGPSSRHLDSGWDWEASDYYATDSQRTAASEVSMVEPFVDDYLTTTNPTRKSGALEVIKTFDDWQDYVRFRYGDEIANEIAKDDGAEPPAGLPVDNMEDYGPDYDLVSDEACVVNAYLERLERRDETERSERLERKTA